MTIAFYYYYYYYSQLHAKSKLKPQFGPILPRIREALLHIYIYIYIYRVAIRKLRKGQICEQGSFEGGGGLIYVPIAHGKLGGSGGMLPQEIFEKRHALRTLLVHFWPCITCICQYQVLYTYIYIYISENWGGGGGANAPLCPPPPPPPNATLIYIYIYTYTYYIYIYRRNWLLSTCAYNSW